MLPSGDKGDSEREQNNPMNSTKRSNNTRSLAIFAIGRFIQYRLDDGMNPKELEPFMQAYLNLEAEAEDRQPHDLHALQSQTITATPEEQREALTISPAWLPDGEKLRHIHRFHDNDLCTTAPDAPA